MGSALQDESFTDGHDTIDYHIAAAGAQGPFRVEAKLWFQPIGYRWATNLAEYDAPEPRRFGEYYRSMSKESALVMATDSISTR